MSKFDRERTNKAVLLRGLQKRCPRCGEGRLLKGYLTQYPCCAFCNEDFSNISADDGPPWLTIFLTGHFMAPFVHYFIVHDTFPRQFELPIMLCIAAVMALAILPYTKGLFIAGIWLSRQKK